jgi:NLR family CARD domain-containing protein 3
VSEASKSLTKTFLDRKIIDIPGTNILQNVIQTKEIITKYYLEDLSCFPRPAPKKIKGLKREKTPWDFKKSVFRDYVPDNELILAKCFEYDWNNSKITKIIKDEKEQEKVKAYLRSIYKHM